MKQRIALLLLCGQVVAPTSGLECSSTHHREPQAEAHHTESVMHTEHGKASRAEITSKPAHEHQYDGESPCLMVGSCGTVTSNVTTVELALPFSTFAIERASHAHVYASPSLAASTPPPKSAS
jgi:hypothetical protein